MEQYKISYIVTTYNKLPYLRQVLGRLVAARLPDEEIVVADGGSTDGSVAYLQDLFARGQIQQFESERDKGEAHGFNKCILRAKGDLLKLITDDDAFNYPVIRACANFMRDNPAVDAMLGLSADIMLHDPAHVHIGDGSNPEEYITWRDKKVPFGMIGLPLMIRRSSLPLLGLFYTDVVLVDIEYILRITKMQANVAWCTNLISVRVNNPDGNYNKMGAKKVKDEFMRVHAFFQGADWWDGVASTLRVQVELAKQPLMKARRAFFRTMGWQRPRRGLGAKTNYVPQPAEDGLTAVYRVCDEVIQSYNQNHKTEFICRQDVQAVQKILAPQG